MKGYIRLKNKLSDQKGQGLVEYGLILAGVAVVGVAVFGILSTTNSGLGPAITGIFTDIATTVTGAGAP